MAKDKKMKKDMYRMEADSMIKEDRNAMANLPQQVVMKEYPKYDYMYGNLDDTARGIDRQMNEDIRGAKKAFKNEKY